MMMGTDQKKKDQAPLDEIKDEPGAEDRFLRGIRKALSTPPKPHKDEPKRGKGGKKTGSENG
jgi:hypothetical protein